jgi:predicted outer membrane protein
MGIVDDVLGEKFDKQIVSRLVEEFDELLAGSPG